MGLTFLAIIDVQNIFLIASTLKSYAVSDPLGNSLLEQFAKEGALGKRFRFHFKHLKYLLTSKHKACPKLCNPQTFI